MDARRREEESSLRGYEHEFERAAEEIRAAVAAQRVRVSDPQKIKLYGLFKQATEGDCIKPQPSAFQPVSAKASDLDEDIADIRARTCHGAYFRVVCVHRSEPSGANGWQSLQGMDATVAKRRYVLLVLELVPTFRMPTDSLQHDAAVVEPTDSDTQPPAAAQAPPSSRRQPSSLSPAAIAQSSRPAIRPSSTVAATRRPVLTRRRQPVEALSYGAIVLQIAGFVALAASLAVGATRVALPFCHAHIEQHIDAERVRAVVRSLTPLFWFALGYLFVAVIRSRIFSWRLLTGEFVWLNLASPRTRATVGGARRRLPRRQRRRTAVAADDEEPVSTAVLLGKFGIDVVEDAPHGSDDNDADIATTDSSSATAVTPHLKLSLRTNEDAVRFGDSVTIFPFTLEQTAHMFYRKFKEPLPDASSPQLVGITLLEEHRFDEFDAVFRRRKLQFTNNAPYLIKRQFAAGDFVEYIEDSLLDQRNRTFYVYTRNESFQSFGSIEDYSVYRVAGSSGQWTELSQGARLHITNSSIGFLRSKLEALAANSYAKNVPRTRAYHLERLCEDFGAPDDDELAETAALARNADQLARNADQ